MYYELLPDWFEYDSANYDIIRHKIGYALFGLPKVNEDVEPLSFSENCTLLADQDNILNRVTYDKKMCKVIDDIYQKIIKFGRNNACDNIHVGIIFNVIFVQMPSKQASEINNEQNKENNNIIFMPIFKIKTETRGIWYIDNEGRTYKTWKDYVTNNTLPQCTMVLPKGGLYQCDPTSKVSEYNSTVWIEILDSPACAIKNKVLKNVDIASNTMAICSLGIGAASIFTPIGPAVLTTGTYLFLNQLK